VVVDQRVDRPPKPSLLCDGSVGLEKRVRFDGGSEIMYGCCEFREKDEQDPKAW